MSAGHPLVGRADRIFPDVLARQRVRGAAVRRGRACDRAARGVIRRGRVRAVARVAGEHVHRHGMRFWPVPRSSERRGRGRILPIWWRASRDGTRCRRTLDERRAYRLSARRRTFPTCDFGSSATTSSSDGTLYGASRSRQNVLSSASVAVIPGRKTTNAFTVSPLILSGSPPPPPRPRSDGPR